MRLELIATCFTILGALVGAAGHGARFGTEREKSGRPPSNCRRTRLGAGQPARSESGGRNKTG
jgi:hypothetical protein